MRVLFLGTPEVAVPSLQALVDHGHDVALVVTRPDRPVGRSKRLLPPPVKLAAEKLGIPVLQPTRLKHESFEALLEARHPDLLIVVAYGLILPPRILRIAPKGAINVHFSLLPSYRGAAPVQWALVHGLAVTGVTTMRMNEKLDEGDLLLQQEVAVHEDEHAPALQHRLSSVGAGLLARTLQRLGAGDLEPRPQDHRRATFAPILTTADGEVDLRRPAREIEGRIRGFDPWPGVWVLRGGKRLRLVRARTQAERLETEDPGRVLRMNGEIVLVCGEGSLLHLDRIQPEGRRVQDVQEAVNGRQILPGDRLESLCSSG